VIRNTGYVIRNTRYAIEQFIKLQKTKLNMKVRRSHDSRQEGGVTHLTGFSYYLWALQIAPIPASQNSLLIVGISCPLISLALAFKADPPRQRIRSRCFDMEKILKNLRLYMTTGFVLYFIARNFVFRLSLELPLLNAKPLITKE